MNLSRSGQLAVKELLAAHLERVERDDRHIPIRLYPVLPGEKEVRSVVIDPAVAFGRPTVAGSGILTSVLVQRIDAGEGLSELAADYGLTEAQIKSAVLFERAAYGCGVLRGPPAMKMAATWFRSARGLAIGTVVGALTVGKATPYLLRAFPSLGWREVVLASSVGRRGAGGGAGGAGYREGPYPFARRPFAWEVVRNRPVRLAIGGYLGHMWELYAAWTFISLFFVDFFAGRGAAEAGAEARAGVVGFAMIAAGGAGSVLAGRWADRLGRERVTIWAMAVSGACALAIGWMGAAPVWLAVTVAVVWGFAVVADSAQFSALVTELAPEHAVGTALTLQTALGFLLTSFSIAAVPPLRAVGGWPLAFGLLAVGPLLGIAAMRRLESARAPAARPAGSYAKHHRG